MRILFVFSAAFCLAASTEAHIGETPSQIAERYGPVIGSPSNTLKEVHRKDGVIVEVAYHQGKCAWISYRREASGGRTVFDQQEVRALLAANAGDEGAWRKEAKEDFWTSADRRLIARVPGTAPTYLLVWTREYAAEHGTQK